MGALGTRKSSLLQHWWAAIVPLALALAISICWNLRQGQLIEDEHQHRLAAESQVAVRARDDAEKATALKKKNAKWAGSDMRLQELYREIDTLSRLNDKVLSQPQARLRKTVIVDNPAETVTAP